MSILSVEKVSHRYRGGHFLGVGHTDALTEITWQLPENKIIGLLGPNASGKSTLMQIMAGFLLPTRGRVLADGRPILTNSAAAQMVHLAREGGDGQGETVRNLLRLHRTLRVGFDLEFARHLLHRFEVNEKKTVSRLSRGKKSCVAAAVALASRAPITILDEVQLGMDVPTRYLFTEELLADYAENPRTYVISSHLVAELANVLEEVTVLKAGRVLVQQSAADFVLAADGKPQSFSEAFLTVIEAHKDPATQVYRVAHN